MSLIATEGSTKRKFSEPMSAGTYMARISSVVDLGIQQRPPYLGVEKPPVQMIHVSYTFPTEEYIDPEEGPTGEPRVLSESFSALPRSVERSKAATRLTRIDPDNEIGNDFSKLAGRPVVVTIVHNPGRGKHEGRVFANVADVTAPVKGVEVEELKGEAVIFDLDSFDDSVFQELPAFVRERIEARITNEPSKENVSAEKSDWEV